MAVPVGATVDEASVILEPFAGPCGYRSSIAASLLARRGGANVSEVAGGMVSWEAANLSH